MLPLRLQSTKIRNFFIKCYLYTFYFKNKITIQTFIIFLFTSFHTRACYFSSVQLNLGSIDSVLEQTFVFNVASCTVILLFWVFHLFLTATEKLHYQKEQISTLKAAHMHE